MEDDFLNRLSAVWSGQEEEATAAPGFHERALAALDTGVLEPVMTELDVAIAQYARLAEAAPGRPESLEIRALLEGYRESLMAGDRPAMDEWFARIEETYAVLATVVDEELRMVSVRPAYGPVEELSGLLTAYLRGRTDRFPLREALANLRPTVESGWRQARESRERFRRKLDGNRAPDLAWRIVELMDQGYARCHSGLHAFEAALEARDVPAMGKALRQVNEGFSRLTQARQACDEAAESQRWL
ncbi:MAG: hypothetical protein AB1758_13720 [Candidatus Eremiobacterota bacterium]